MAKARRPVPTPEAVAEGLGVSGFSRRSSKRIRRAWRKKLFASRLGPGSPVPVVEVFLERDAQCLDFGSDLFADVQTICELATEDRDDTPIGVDFDGMLSAQLGPVDVFLVTLHRQQQPVARTPQRSAMMSSLVSGAARSSRALICPRRKSMSFWSTSVNGVSTRCVGGANDRPSSHRDHVEQSLGVVVERKHLVMVFCRDPRHHQVDALGVDDAVFGVEAPLMVGLVDKWTGGVDNGGGRRREFFATVGAAQLWRPTCCLLVWPTPFRCSFARGRACLDGRTNEAEDESGVRCRPKCRRDISIPPATVSVLIAGSSVSMSSVLSRRGYRVPKRPIIQ